MDFKFKGMTWVGNIYQKFENMCQEVDDIVSQEKVKYVENQVQTVGNNVKKFCSDVQDLLPPLADTVKREVQAVSLKQNAAFKTYIKSMIGVGENLVDVGVKQSSVEPDAIEAVKNQLDHASSFSELHHVNELFPTSSMDPIKGEESILFSGENENVAVYMNSDVRIEENVSEDQSSSAMLDIIAPTDKDPCEESMFSGFIDENHENACGIQIEASVTSDHQVEGSKVLQKSGTSCDDFVYEKDCVSDVLNTLPFPELSLSVLSSERKDQDTGFISSSSSLCENLPTSFHEKSGKISNPLDAMMCISTTSSTASSSESPLDVSCENTEDMRLASSVLSLESNDVVTPRLNETVSVLGTPGNRLLRSWESTQFESFTSSEIGWSDDCSDHINDPGMQTIELRDKVKLEESCVMVNNNELHAVSRRAQNLRSYKKKIKDAFASKKRRVKEYEQLAIWFGDVDTDSSQLTTPSGSKNLARRELCDSEWELV